MGKILYLQDYRRNNFKVDQVENYMLSIYEEEYNEWKKLIKKNNSRKLQLAYMKLLTKNINK